jgi:Fe2+ transport system protein FeoA
MPSEQTMKKKLISICKAQNIPHEQFAPLKQRLESLGFFPDTEVEVLKKISFGHVVIVRIFQTVVALNKMEFSCLKF